MKDRICIALISFLAGGLVVYFSMQATGVPDATSTPGSDSRTHTHRRTRAVDQGQHAAADDDLLRLKAVDAPRALKGFADMSTRDRLAVVSRLQEKKTLSPEVRAYLKKAVRVRSLDPTLRNNMANCLFHSQQPDETLYKLFAERYDDPHETAVFRDFAVQFLARSYAAADDRAAVLTKLREIAMDDPTRVAGTAFIQLSHLEREGLLTLAPATLKAMGERLREPDAPLALRLAVVTAVGRRGSGSPAVMRTIRTATAAGDTCDGLRRTCIATLGRCGGPADVELIKPYLNHESGAVVLAAKEALRRLAAERYGELLREARARRTVAAGQPGMRSISHSSRDGGRRGLAFETLKKTISADVNEKDLTCEFAFTNTTDEPIRIVALRTNCSCAVAALEPRLYAPGASGTIRVALDLRNRQRNSTMTVYAQTDEPESEFYRLTIRARVPQYLTTSTGTIACHVGADPRPLPIDILAPHPDRPMNITRIAKPVDNPFKVELVTIKPGRHWRLEFTPLNTLKPCKASYTIVTDYPEHRPLKKIVRAKVIGPATR